MDKSGRWFYNREFFTARISLLSRYLQTRTFLPWRIYSNMTSNTIFGRWRSYFGSSLFLFLTAQNWQIAHEEDLENFLLSLRDCLERIDRNEFPGNINFLEHFRDRLEGYIRIIMAISLVVSNLKSGDRAPDS